MTLYEAGEMDDTHVDEHGIHHGKREWHPYVVCVGCGGLRKPADLTDWPVGAERVSGADLEGPEWVCSDREACDVAAGFPPSD